MLSTGDGADRWIDEYSVTAGTLFVERWLWAPDLMATRADFYDALAAERGDSRLADFARFCRSEYEAIDDE